MPIQTKALVSGLVVNSTTCLQTEFDRMSAPTDPQTILVVTDAPGGPVSYQWTSAGWVVQAAAANGLPIGGTTGQALVKNSNANGDAIWAAAGGSLLSGIANTYGAVQRQGLVGSQGTNVGVNAGNGRLLGNQHMAFGAFKGVRLIFANYDTTLTQTINACAVAPAAVSLTNGNVLNWSPLVTFDNGASTSKIVPAATASAHLSPGLVRSDFIGVNSIPRTDGGTMPILQVRTHISDSALVANGTNGANSTLINAEPYNQGFRTGYNAQAGLVANLKTDSMALANGFSVLQPVAVEFVYGAGTKVFGMSIFGDSLVSGQTYTVGSESNWGFRLMNLAYAAGLNLRTATYAQSGEVYADTMRIARAHLAIHKPTFMGFASWSVNSGVSAAVFDACWATCLDMVSACREAGVTPVVWRHAPDQGVALILTQNQRIDGLPSWVCRPDLYTALGNPASTATLLPAYWGDGVGEHYNDAGHAAAAAEVLSKITPFCA